MFFYQLFGCPKGNFIEGKRVQAALFFSMLITCMCRFDVKVTRSLVMKFCPKSVPCTSEDLRPEHSEFESNMLSHCVSCIGETNTYGIH